VLRHDTRSSAIPHAHFSLAVRRLVATIVFAVWAMSLAGCGDDTPSPVSLPSTLSAPTGVIAVAGNGSVSLSWDVVAGATAYRIYWDTAGSVDASDSVITVTLPELAHSSLTNGTNYYYRVNASNTAGESALSAQVTAMPTGAAAFRLIACGPSASFLVNDAGLLYAWGDNTFGQLGIGSFARKLRPTVVRGVGDIVAVAAGGRHVIALSGSGRAYAWGSNDWGQLGDGSRSLRWTPY